MGKLAANQRDGVRFAIERAIANRFQLISGRLRRLFGRPVSPCEIALYELMRRDNASAPSLYHPDEFVAGFGTRFLNYVYAGSLRQFRNSHVSNWFSGPPPTARGIYTFLLWLYYSRLREIDTDDFLLREEEPEVAGADDQEAVAGRAMSLDFLQSVEEAYRIREAWAMAGHSGAPRLIVELGGGYGRLAYVCRQMMPNATYVLLDLPEALLCAHSWLSRTLISGHVNPYLDARTFEPKPRETLCSKPVWLLGVHAVEQLQDADVFVSIHNQNLMTKAAVDNYFSHIDRVAKIFYCKQYVARPDDTGPGMPFPYPFRRHWHLLFSRTTTLSEYSVEEAYQIRP